MRNLKISKQRRCEAKRRRAVQRKRAAPSHPIYAARGNEQPLLEQLIADDPPAGGLAQYIADLDCKRG